MAYRSYRSCAGGRSVRWRGPNRYPGANRHSSRGTNRHSSRGTNRHFSRGTN